MPLRSRPTLIARFRATLLEIDPPIWRRFEIDEAGTFWDLHVALQDVFGWKDCHLHSFAVVEPGGRTASRIGIPDPDEFPGDRREFPGWEVPLRGYPSLPGFTVRYEYDFGDGWIHEVTLEEVAPADPAAKYPRCLGGERACPPEDCGGPSGFEHLLEVLADPTHEGHEELRDWAPRGFDPERFTADAVVFHDPKRRLRNVLR